jgi:glyoxylase-like metal-dependent hydrolase (beta-lactamase superfamily II)
MLLTVGSMTIDTIVDGETRRTIDFLYPAGTAEERAEAETFSDRITGELVMTIGSYLVRFGDRVVLFDTGVGSQPVGTYIGGALRSALLAQGVALAEITDVIFTHLHADHIGWATQNGQPFFPNATYRCDRRDWNHFVSPEYEIPAWEIVSSTPEHDAARVRLAPLADRMVFWEGDAEVLPGITAIDAAGHTPGTDAFLLESDGERALLLGDIAHSVHELLFGWDFPVHYDHEAALAALRRVRSLAVEQHLPVSAAHFTGMGWGYVTHDGDRFRWQSIH